MFYEQFLHIEFFPWLEVVPVFSLHVTLWGGNKKMLHGNRLTLICFICFHYTALCATCCLDFCHSGFWFACWIVGCDCLQWKVFTAYDSVVRTTLFRDAFVWDLISVALWNPALWFLVSTFSEINRLSVTCGYRDTSILSSKKHLVCLPVVCSLGDGGKAAGF